MAAHAHAELLRGRGRGCGAGCVRARRRRRGLHPEWQADVCGIPPHGADGRRRGQERVRAPERNSCDRRRHVRGRGHAVLGSVRLRRFVSSGERQVPLCRSRLECVSGDARAGVRSDGRLRRGQPRQPSPAARLPARPRRQLLDRLPDRRCRRVCGADRKPARRRASQPRQDAAATSGRGEGSAVRRDAHKPRARGTRGVREGRETGDSRARVPEAGRTAFPQVDPDAVRRGVHQRSGLGIGG